MTMPYERRNAVNTTRIFLLDLLAMPDIPESVRDQAYYCLKHYPGEYYMEEARIAAPEVFGNWEDMKHDNV